MKNSGNQAVSASETLVCPVSSLCNHCCSEWYLRHWERQAGTWELCFLHEERGGAATLHTVLVLSVDSLDCICSSF